MSDSWGVAKKLTGGTGFAAAEQPKQAGSVAPVPEQILTTKSVFISIAVEGCGGFEKGGFPGRPDVAYNEFYLAMKNAGRYELASAPAEADLEFEIGFSCPPVSTTVTNGQRVGRSINPQFSLRILDVRTHRALWRVTEHLKRPGPNPLFFIPLAGPILVSAGLKKHELKRVEKKCEAAMPRLLDDAETLTTQP